MRIVLGIDGSDIARDAARYVAALPLPEGSSAVLVAVTGEGRSEEASTLLESEAGLLRDAGLEVSTETRTGSPAAEIVAAADEHDADLVAVGSHGVTGFKRFLLGSVSSQVFRHASRSVLVVRAREHGCEGTHQPPPATGHAWRILVGYDASDSSDRAVRFCERLDLDAEASLRLLTVLPMVTMFRQDVRQELDVTWQQRKDAEKASLHDAAERLRRGRATVTTALVEAEDVSEAILEAADELDADVIVLGHKGRGSVERFLMGSVAPRIVQHACQAVLAVR